MIVFAGIVPCSPLLLPSINPERIGMIEKTRTALAEMAEELFATHPDTVVIFCEHAHSPKDAFALNIADPYYGTLAAFGDLGFRSTYRPDLLLTDAIQRNLRKSHEPITLITEDELPFSATVPLSFLLAHVPNALILPFSPCDRTAKEHFDFGASLRNILLESTKRIAVIAAGDFSHTRSEDAPGGFNAEGEASDMALETLIVHKNTAGLLNMDPNVLAQAQNTAYRQVVMLFGALDGAPVDVRLLSHEAPFGVGEIVAEFITT